MAEWRFQLGMLHTEAAIRNIRKSKKKKKNGTRTEWYGGR